MFRKRVKYCTTPRHSLHTMACNRWVKFIRKVTRMAIQGLPSLVSLGEKKIGDGHPIYIMADLGLTNCGDMKVTFELIDTAASLGVDCVKFQMIGPQYLLSDRTAEWTYPTINNGNITENMYEMFCDLEFSDEQWLQIYEYAKERGLEFICTAHHMKAVPLLEKIGVNIHKICTWSSDHKRLVQEIGKTGKPLMLDTGTMTTATLTKLLDWHSLSGGRDAIILHDFHTDEVSEMNFRAIPYMKQLFGNPVGYTPQGRDSDLDFLSIGLGVNVLEKRLTLDRATPRNGHHKALEPEEFRTWLSKVRKLEIALGKSCVLPTKQDTAKGKLYLKSLFLNCDVKENSVITDDMIEARRPGDGILASKIDTVIGKYTRHSLPAMTKLNWKDLC